MRNKVKEHIGLHYLFTKIQLFTRSIKKKQRLISYSQYFRIQDDGSIMCGLYCIGFIEYMVPGKILLDYTYLFYRNDYRSNNNMIYK